MCKLICVTERRLCDDFLSRIDAICSAGADAVLLREKDLGEADYARLARQVDAICRAHNVELIVHSHISVANELARTVHLPMPQLLACGKTSVNFGTSCHSADEAVAAARLGAKYVIAGHIFDTPCKDGPGRGLEFLGEVCRRTSVPVYAIGGISADNARDVIRFGASGVCFRSGAMTCDDIDRYFASLKRATKTAKES